MMQYELLAVVGEEEDTDGELVVFLVYTDREETLGYYGRRSS